MRLWSIHPRHLDVRGLVALWREALLAQKVLAGGTRGYRHHPQLQRFRESDRPLDAIGAYLHGVRQEAECRGYRFDPARILHPPARASRWPERLKVSRAQLDYERDHLHGKLLVRDPARAGILGEKLEPHPLFRVTSGGIARWEIQPPAEGASRKHSHPHGPAPRHNPKNG